MWWYDGMGWWMILGGVMMLTFWAGIIFLVVWGIKRLTNREGAGEAGRNSSALDIARERYARGEISREEFEQIRKDIS